MITDWDDAYDNGGHIGGAADYPPRWATAAAAFRDALGARAELDIPYGHGDRRAFDLLHPEEDKTVNVSTSTDRRAWRGKWEDYARRLDLPALENGDGGLIARDAGDLDKSVGELARDGKIAVVDVDLSARGYGVRSRRYAMVVDDGVVKDMAVEEGASLNVSSAEKMLDKV